jgi:leucine dehydrogenase
MGGTRFYPFASERDALVDVLRLARGMAYKHAVCGNDLGGGKAVILGDPRTLRTDALVRAYAQFVDRLGGRYLTAEDVGTTQADMDLIRTVTPHVTGISESLGGSGDPSPATAWGVYHALLAVAERRWGDASLADLHVAIAGTGKVGSDLARRLAAAGCRLTLADVRDDVVVPLATELRADIVEPDRVHAVVCDVFSPCALGATLNERTIPELQCAAICGCANNQLATDEDGDRLADAGVLYAPDYVANAGGVINIADELGPSGYDRERAYARVATIEETVRRVFDRATADGVTPARAADRLAEERLGVSRQPS